MQSHNLQWLSATVIKSQDNHMTTMQLALSHTPNGHKITRAKMIIFDDVKHMTITWLKMATQTSFKGTNVDFRPKDMGRHDSILVDPCDFDIISCGRLQIVNQEHEFGGSLWGVGKVGGRRVGLRKRRGGDKCTCYNLTVPLQSWAQNYPYTSPSKYHN